MIIVNDEKEKVNQNEEDEHVNKMIQSFKEENPNLSEEEIEELKKVLSQIVATNKRNLNNVSYFNKVIKTFIIYILSSLSTLGFFFSFVALENRALSIFIPIIITIIFTIYELIKFIQFVKKPLVTTIKPYIYEMIIICLIGFLVNEYLLIFKFSIILPMYIIFTVIMKLLVNSLINKIISKKKMIERRDNNV